MPIYPRSRIVNVNVSYLDRFVAAQTFGTPLIITSETTGGLPVNSTTRTKLYSDMSDVAADWADTSKAYKAAAALFAQRPRPIQVKIGYVAPGVLTTPTPSPTITAELNAIRDFDNQWYGFAFTSEFRDNAIMDQAIAWAQAYSTPSFGFYASNAVATENPADTTSLAARNKSLYSGTVARGAVFYHPTAFAAEYIDMAALGYVSTWNFDQVNSATTLMFKVLQGISPCNLRGASVQAATGNIPGVGVDKTVGHCANVYVDTNGTNMIVQGTTFAGGFIDEVIFGDWLKARTEEAIISYLANRTGRVPMTNSGLEELVGVVQTVLERARIAGFLAADDIDKVTGELMPPYKIATENILAITDSQRRQRVAPAIRAYFRYAGAIHYATIDYEIRF